MEPFFLSRPLFGKTPRRGLSVPPEACRGGVLVSFCVTILSRVRHKDEENNVMGEGDQAERAETGWLAGWLWLGCFYIPITKAKVKSRVKTALRQEIFTRKPGSTQALLPGLDWCVAFVCSYQGLYFSSFIHPFLLIKQPTNLH
ncbi:hypothetical protein E2C01_071592 [Portunus trituberculatus]|uniref:Uncharacterized protein n=1 Tax=Portunus trituberculatus TaxID=210409 RepID=A0A5B7I4U4_PORTR|nr:hypothetical protein [Portunus trituberculatus]